MAYLAVADLEMRALRGEEITGEVVVESLIRQSPDVSMNDWARALDPVLRERGYQIEFQDWLEPEPSRKPLARVWWAIGAGTIGFWLGVVLVLNRVV